MGKIVFLIAHLGGGGAERVTVSLANYFSDCGYDVELIVFDNSSNEYSVNSEIRINYLKSSSIKVLDMIFKVLYLKKYLKKMLPHYVISLGFSYRYLYIGNLMNKYKFILSERNDPNQMYGKLDLYIVKYCLKKAKHVVFQTSDAKQFFEENIQNHSSIIPNPIKQNMIEPYFGDRENRIVAFSRLNSQKNIPMLLQAFSVFAKQHNDYKLEIYGKGELEEKLKQLTKDLKIDNSTRFMGFSKNVHEDILRAKMFVSTSNYEGISNSMLEAMALGLPCICTDCPVGGSRMFIKSGANGILIKVGDTDDLVNKMNKLENLKELADEIGKNATRIREELSIVEIGNRWIKLLD
jgi:glycosyltransferase involved in cell wall biosynthesis